MRTETRAAEKQRFERLAAVFGPRVLAYLARRADPPADAADIYQEVLVTTWRRLQSVPTDDAGALAWMLAVARRCLANHRRGVLRRLSATTRLRTITETAVGHGEPDHDLNAVLDELSADDRELVTLIYWDGLSTEEAARVLSVAPATARKRLQRARHRLREALGEEDSPSASIAAHKST